MTWTKKFNCSNTVMREVVQMLEEAIEKRRVSAPLFYLCYIKVVDVYTCAWPTQKFYA